jgi:hypothetical protein
MNTKRRTQRSYKALSDINSKIYTHKSFMVQKQSGKIQDLPLDFTGRNFTVASCLDAEDFNNCPVL